MINTLRGIARISFFGLGSLIYIFRYLIKAALVGKDYKRAIRLRQEWIQMVCKAVGANITRHGELPARTGLLICNHRSYFDPVIVLKDVLAWPVSKSEVSNWPIIGWAMKLSGIVFVKRASVVGRGQARIAIIETLESGFSIINYPEGTTHNRNQTIAFKMGVFKDAVKGSYPIYPIAIEYQREADAWIGNDTFFRHFFECFGKRQTNIKVSYGPAIYGSDSKELMLKSKNWIDAELLRLRANWHIDTRPKE